MICSSLTCVYWCCTRSRKIRDDRFKRLYFEFILTSEIIMFSLKTVFVNDMWECLSITFRTSADNDVSSNIHDNWSLPLTFSTQVNTSLKFSFPACAITRWTILRAMLTKTSVFCSITAHEELYNSLQVTIAWRSGIATSFPCVGIENGCNLVERARNSHGWNLRAVLPNRVSMTLQGATRVRCNWRPTPRLARNLLLATRAPRD